MVRGGLRDPLTEARWRLEATDGVGLLGPLLEENEADTVGGFYIQRQPTYRLFVLHTANGEETLGEYTSGKSFDIQFEVRPVRYTLAELEAAQMEWIDMMQIAGIRASSGINVMENQVEIYVSDRASVDAKLAAAGLTLPEPVQVIEVTEQDVDD